MPGLTKVIWATIIVLASCFASSSGDDLLSSADAHRDSHDFSTAATEYTAYLRTHPKSIQALAGRAKAYLGLGLLAEDDKEKAKQYDLARKDYLQIHRLEPRNEKAYIDEIVVCNSVFQSYETLIPSLELGLNNLPGSYNLLELKVSMYYKLGKLDVVRTTLDGLIRSYPSKYQPYSQRAQLSSEEGKHSEAANDYARAIELCADKPVSVLLLERRCRENIALQNYDAAQTDVDKAIGLSPDAWVLYGLRGSITLNRPLKSKDKQGVAAEVKAIVESAFPDIDKAVSKGLNEFIGYRADCYCYYKKYDLAIEDYQKYFETTKDPRDGAEWKRRDAAKLNCLLALAKKKE